MIGLDQRHVNLDVLADCPARTPKLIENCVYYVFLMHNSINLDVLADLSSCPTHT